MDQSTQRQEKIIENTQKCFISWNSRGLKNKKDDLEILAKQLDPFCICNQETKMKTDQSFSLKNYVFKHKPKTLQDGEIAHGGVGIFIKNDIPFTEINLVTNFQAIAFQFFLPLKLTICTIYIHEKDNLSLGNLENLIEQLPKPFILVGDFNSHNTLWFDKKQTIAEKSLKILY